MATFSNSHQFASVEGNPTSEENAVLAAVIESMRDDRDTAAQYIQNGKDEASPDPDARANNGSESEASPVQDLEEHRRCPICQRRFDSQFVLTAQRRITASKDSTLCFDTEYDRIYLHSTE